MVSLSSIPISMKFSFPTLIVAAATVVGLVTAASHPLRRPSLLIFTKTSGYRHGRHAPQRANVNHSIPAGIELVTSLAREQQWETTATEDASVFTTDGLAKYTSLVFISTTGDFLDANQSTALNEYMLGGGSWLGIHAAGDFGSAFPAWFTTLVGAQFLGHPSEPHNGIIPSFVTLTDHEHPSTRNLPSNQTRTDEWYSYKTNPSQDPRYRILVQVDDGYLTGEINQWLRMEPVHPISWCSLYEGAGRAWYTGMGHTVESYTEDYFIKHVTGGLLWVIGVEEGQC